MGEYPTLKHEEGTKGGSGIGSSWWFEEVGVEKLGRRMRGRRDYAGRVSLSVQAVILHYFQLHRKLQAYYYCDTKLFTWNKRYSTNYK